MRSHTNPTRRQFIKSAAFAAAAPLIIPATAIGRGGRPAPSERINLACFGFGTIAHPTNKSFLNDERVQIVAIADVNKESGNYGYKGEKQGGREAGRKIVEKHYGKQKDSDYKGCNTYEDFRELLDKEDVDAVNVATPDHWHAYMAIYCARKGKHIFGQKPLSLTVAEGRKMVEEVTKAGVTWQTGSQQRSDIYFRQACEFVRNDRIGKLQTVKVGLPGGHNDWNQMGDQKDPAPIPKGLNFDFWQGQAPARDYRPALLPLNWRHNFDYSGGMITDFGAHHIDMAHWGMDMDNSGPVRIDNIKGTLADPKELYNTAGTFSFECTYANGVKMLVGDETSGFRTGVTFEGEKGMSIFVTRGNIETNPADLRRNKIKDGEIRLYNSRDHYRNFIDCIYSGEPTAAPIETAHRTITVSHLVNIALRLGVSSLRWDPENEQVVGNEAANAMLSRTMRDPWTLG